MYHDNYSRHEFDDLSIVIIGIFLLLFLIGAISIFYILPLSVIHFIDAMFFGEIIPWPFEMVFAIGILIFGLFLISTVPKNPITWYIYFNSPVIIIYNKKGSDEQIRYIKEVENWLTENTNGQWRRSRNWCIGKIEYQFLQPSDAMAFKIRWT